MNFAGIDLLIASFRLAKRVRLNKIWLLEMSKR
jgi:hypothetical protein